MATENKPDMIKVTQEINGLVRNEDLPGLHGLLAFYNHKTINALVGKAMCDVIDDLDTAGKVDGKMNKVSDYLLSRYGIPENVFDKAVHTLTENGWPFDFPYLMRREDITASQKETLQYCMIGGALNAGAMGRVPELAKMCCLVGLPQNVQIIALESLEDSVKQCGKDGNFVAIARGFEVLQISEMSIAAIGKQQPKVAERLEMLRADMEHTLIDAAGEIAGNGRVKDVEQLVQLFSAVKSPRTRERMEQEVHKQLAMMENALRLPELARFTLPGLEEKLPMAITKRALENYIRLTGGTVPAQARISYEMGIALAATIRPPARRPQEPPNGGIPLKR